MTIIVGIGALALLAWAAMFVGYPLLKAQREPPARDSEYERQRQELLFQRDNAYAAIQELEADHRLGNLSREDLRALEEQYTLRAAVLLKELDTLEQGMAQQADAEIEKAVARYRRARPAGS